MPQGLEKNGGEMLALTLSVSLTSFIRIYILLNIYTTLKSIRINNWTLGVVGPGISGFCSKRNFLL
jgi:hypothetical protein